MAKSYSYDLRTKVIEAIDRGMKKTEASRIFNLSRNTIDLWLKKRQLTGDYQEKKGYQKGHSRKIKDWEKFREFVIKHGSKTQGEMSEAWHEEISPRTISRGLKKIGFTRKKRTALRKPQLRI